MDMLARLYEYLVKHPEKMPEEFLRDDGDNRFGCGSRAHQILGVFHLLHPDKRDSLPRIGTLDLGRRLALQR